MSADLLGVSACLCKRGEDTRRHTDECASRTRTLPHSSTHGTLAGAHRRQNNIYRRSPGAPRPRYTLFPNTILAQKKVRFSSACVCRYEFLEAVRKAALLVPSLFFSFDAVHRSRSETPHAFTKAACASG